MRATRHNGRSLGVPHRTAWQRIQEMESCLGVRLLETTSGGPRGGGSHLSTAGRDVVRRYQALRTGPDELVLDRYQGAFHGCDRLMRRRAM